MTLASVSVDLRQCAGCGWWTRWLSAQRRCGDCTRGWHHCPSHGRLEQDDGRHRRVSVAEVLAAVPDVHAVALAAGIAITDELNDDDWDRPITSVKTGGHL